jgi:hypothetical protein
VLVYDLRRDLFKRTGTIEDLNRTTKVIGMAAEVISKDDVESRAISMSNLSDLLDKQFGCLKAIEGIDLATDATIVAIDVLPPLQLRIFYLCEAMYR